MGWKVEWSEGQALQKSLQGRELSGTLQLINRTPPGNQGRERGEDVCLTAEPATVLKSLSLDVLASLKPNNNINAHLHPKVTHLQSATTSHWACALYSF